MLPGVFRGSNGSVQIVPHKHDAYTLYCWFWSYDHDPAHFHVKRRGEWELPVKFLDGPDSMFEIKWGEEPN